MYRSPAKMLTARPVSSLDIRHLHNVLIQIVNLNAQFIFYQKKETKQITSSLTHLPNSLAAEALSKQMDHICDWSS